MNAGQLPMGNAVRWDTNDNKIYFDTERWPLAGRLVLRKNTDGQIDMYIMKGESKAPAAANPPHPLPGDRPAVTARVALAE